MATKRVNFALVNDNALEIMSNYMVARKEGQEIEARFNPDIKALQSDLNGLADARKDFINEHAVDGKLLNTDIIYVQNNYNEPIARKTVALKTLQDKKRAQMKPVNARLTAGRKIVPNPKALHDAYVVASIKGACGIKGSVSYQTVEKKKDGTTSVVTKEVTAEKSFTAEIRDFLKSIGMDASNDKAVEKLARMLAMRVSGDVKARKSDTVNLTTFKSQAVLSEMILLVFIQIAFIENRAFKQNEDGSLERVQF